MNANAPLSKYADRLSEDGATAASDAEGTENLGAFGYLRGASSRAQMLELRRKTGNIRAIGYGWIDKVDFDPSTGITIFTGGEKITIRGRNLNTPARQQVSVLGGILRHRVPWIGEADQSTLLQADKQAVVIESIEW